MLKDLDDNEKDLRLNVIAEVIEIALFNTEGKFYAISNRCAHEGGPLNEGVLEGHIVTCPWHGWKYSVIDGKAPHMMAKHYLLSF